MVQNTVTRRMMGLCRSQTPPYMVMYGRTISTTGCCTPSTLRRDPRPEPRGQDRDPRLPGGRHLPGEDGRPRDRGERERGSATTCSTPASLTRSHCRILITLYCVTISISSIHTFKPQLCLSLPWYIVSGINPRRPRFRRRAFKFST